MKLLTLLNKLFESEASDEAHSLGLRYKGRGYWTDKSGKTVAKTVGGKLTKMADGEEEAPEEAPTAPQPTAAPANTPLKLTGKFKEPEYVAPEKSSKLTGGEILDDQIGGQAGSNDGGFYRGTDGKERYVKFYEDPQRAHAEVLACQMYRDLGLGAPVTQTFNHPSSNGKVKVGFASEIIDGETLQTKGLDKELANKILDGFATDILTANWDAIGLTQDNILVDTNNNVYRIDNGGCFMFRAMEDSGRKPDAVLNQISEWNRFSIPDQQTGNVRYAEVFKAAGVKNADALGERVIKQIQQIADFQQKVGGWETYIEQTTPEMDPKDKAIAAKMLNSRTALLLDKAHELQGL